MSKTERIAINYSDSDVLPDLNFVELLKERQKYAAKESEYKSRKDGISKTLIGVIDFTGADSVLYEDSKGKWTVSVVRPEASEKTNEDKLRENMMKIGKLDAETVALIFKRSQDKVPAREPYLAVYPPRNGHAPNGEKK